MSNHYHGSCQCGAVTFSIYGDIKAITHCHCSMCRKSHSAVYATYAATLKDNFSLKGEEHLTAFLSSPGVIRRFCKHCGASVQWLDSGKYSNEWVTFSLPLLDTPFIPKKQKHIYTDDKLVWLAVCDAHKQYPKGCE
ncbi:MAG: GFA family protein [Photobacterium halotolerans]